MNKRKFFALLLSAAMLLLLVSACAAPAVQTPPAPTEAPPAETAPPPAEPEKTKFTPGTYTGTGNGINGAVTVSVTFTEDAIEKIVVDDHKETAGIGDVAIKEMPVRIIESQSLAVDAISGATVSSRAVLAAVEDCVNQVNGDIAALMAAPAQGSNAASSDETVDIVVIGGAGAGITAALNASYAGKSVILVEKMSMLGGNTVMATTQMWAAGSAMQKAEGLTETAEDFYTYMTEGKGAGLGMDPAATMAMAVRSGELVDWLVEIGVPFGRVFNTYSHGPAGGSAPGIALMEGLQKELDRVQLDYRLDTRATEILMKDGAAAGISVTGPNGDYTINADAVIICTGGFSNNPEMVAKYDPRWATLGFSCSVSQTGDGILMAQAVGADVADMDIFTINPSVYFQDDLRLSLTPLRANGAIMVNKHGKRFTNEMGNYTTQTEALLQQDDQAAYMVFDEGMMEIGLMKEYRDKGYFVTADSIEAVAEAAGIDAAGLAETVETYKTYVEADADPDFGRTYLAIDFKKPPFYAVKVAPAIQATGGGIKVDAETHVISTTGEIIPGLFAAGAVAGEGTKAVSPLTKTFAFGKIACESAVAYIDAE